MDTEPDPYGQAAFMVCESLLLLLLERGIVRKDETIDAIDGLIDVKREIAGHRESIAVSAESVVLLKALAQSLAAAAEGTT